MPRGKPITPEQEQAFLELVALGNTVARAAETLGLSPGPFYRRLADESEFSNTFRDEIRPQFRDRLEQTLIDIALGNEKPTHSSQVTALIIALKRYDPDYRESQRHIVEGKNGGPIEVMHADILDLEIGRILAQLAGRRQDEAAGQASSGTVDLPKGDVRRLTS